MKKKDIRMIIITFVIGGIILGPLSYFKTRADIEARLINFDKNNSIQYGAIKGNVQDAMDEIYDLAMAKQANSVYRYADGEIVYYNPVTNRGCTVSDYKSGNSTTGYKGDANSSTQNGCLLWYAYLDEAGQDKVKIITRS